MELGIIGLPTSGKTTIFNALTRGDRPTLGAPAGKLELHRATIDVPDARLDALSALYEPKKTTHAQVTYVDIAGLEQDMKQDGLSGTLRNQIATMDAFVHVVRAFENVLAPHPLESIDPQRDLELFDSEMLLADLITVENRLATIEERLQKGARGTERQALEADTVLFSRLQEALEAEHPLRDIDLTEDEQERLRGFGLLTLKPVLVLLNTDEDTPVDVSAIEYKHANTAIMTLRGQLEMEISQLPPEEVEVFLKEFEIEDVALNRVIRQSYELVGLISFFTVSEEEVRAWTLLQGGTALDAAATIHTDLARGFIRAEVIVYEKLLDYGDLSAARREGELRLEGKDYVVKDGEIVHVRFSI